MSDTQWFGDLLLPRRQGGAMEQVNLVEQWYRRILQAAALVKYGEDWEAMIPTLVYPDDPEKRRQLLQEQEMLGRDAATTEELIQRLDLRELGDAVAARPMLPRVRQWTQLSGGQIREEIRKADRLRRIFSHTGKVGSGVISAVDGSLSALKGGIENFRSAVADTQDDLGIEANQIHAMLMDRVQSRIAQLGPQAPPAFNPEAYGCLVREHFLGCLFCYERDAFIDLQVALPLVRELKGIILEIHKSDPAYSIWVPQGHPRTFEWLSAGVIQLTVDAGIQAEPILCPIPYEEQSADWAGHPRVWFR